MVKYVLIISQYYYSYVQVICDLHDDFIDKAKAMIKELEYFKRNEEERDTRADYFGDLQDKYSERIHRLMENGGRINLNDAGDIYFELSNSPMHLISEIRNYEEKSDMHYKIDKKDKVIMKQVAKHHDADKILEIIEKYFVAA